MRCEIPEGGGLGGPNRATSRDIISRVRILSNSFFDNFEYSVGPDLGLAVVSKTKKSYTKNYPPNYFPWI
jgi:hypothetical protein